MSANGIVRRSLAGLRANSTDWERVRATTDSDITADIEADPDLAPIANDAWFANATLVQPQKEQLTIRLDKDVVDFFRSQGPRYQTRINAVLRQFVDHARKTDSR